MICIPMNNIVSGGGTEKHVCRGRLKCRSYISAAFLWSGATLLLVPMIGDYENPLDMFKGLMIWALLSPALVFAIIAFYFRCTEKPTDYELEGQAAHDPKNLY